jgi:polysaccharide biosynthesis protein PslG
MRTCFRGLVACAATTIALVSGVSAASAEPLFGFNDNSAAMGQVTPAIAAQLATNAGATSTRVLFNWRDSERQPGVLRLDGYDKIYSESIARGIRPVFTLAFAPSWAWSPTVTCAAGADCRYPPAPERDAAWRRIVTTIVKRYPDLAALEIWNEPNLNSFWQGGIDPARYTSLLTQAYGSARAAGSQVPILGGALAPNFEVVSAAGMAYRGFLKKMYDAGAKGAMNGIAIHPYPDDVDYWRFYKMLTDVRDVRDDAGDSASKLWITEFGASTTDPANVNFAFDTSSQAVMLVSLAAKLRAMPDVAGVFVHTLISPTIFSATSSNFGYGVVGPQPNLVPKPAYCAIAAANKTGYVCPAGIATELLTPGVQVLRWRAQDLLQSAADAARAYRARTGSYTGLTSAELHAAAPTISATAAVGTDQPGPLADASRVRIWVTNTVAGQYLVLCNTSQADRSYCISSVPGKGWTYGKAEGSISAAVSATNQSRSWWW